MKKELSKYWQYSDSRTVGRKILPGFQCFPWAAVMWGGSHQAHLMVRELDLRNKPEHPLLTQPGGRMLPTRCKPSLSYIVFQVCVLLCFLFLTPLKLVSKDSVSVCLKIYLCMHLYMYKCKYAFNLPSQNSFPTHLLLNRCCLYWSIWLLLAFCA